MSDHKNILFIMCDQLRFDYLSCYGHKTLPTPNIDKLAERGVLFQNCYVQSPSCGPSRMSTYTGRYVSSHGSTWNFVPLRVGERTMGDYLRQSGIKTAIIGKTHMIADKEGMELLGIDPGSKRGVEISQCGFEPYERDDGVHPDAVIEGKPKPRYFSYLNERGYKADNPWHTYANSTQKTGSDDINSGWYLEHTNDPARVADADSETPYLTRRAMEFIAQNMDRPWCLHLSYIKPHWPYVAPAPYNDIYGINDLAPVKQHPSELQDAHPIYREFMKHPESQNFAQDDVREKVIPVYMGLVKQIDDQMGVLFGFLEDHDLFENTMIVFCSDHGDYLGDHYLGDKELFHDCSSKIPLIIYDPRPGASEQYGKTESALTESIDLLPTFLDFFDIEIPEHIIEGRSLSSILHGEALPVWREYAVSEFDYSFKKALRDNLSLEVKECKSYMLRSEQWKYIFHDKFRPQLYNLITDPDEYFDLGNDERYKSICDTFAEELFRWLRYRKTRVTMKDEVIKSWTELEKQLGIFIGLWSEKEEIKKT